MSYDRPSSTHPRGVMTGLASLCGLKACGECDMPHINYLGCLKKGKLWIMKVSSKGCTYLYEYNDVGAVPSGRQIDVEKSTLSKMTTEVTVSNDDVTCMTQMQGLKQLVGICKWIHRVGLYRIYQPTREGKRHFLRECENV